MLDTAAELFHTQGYHATGLTQLTTASGAPKGSLYFHFPGGKEQLAAEALAMSGAAWREALAAALSSAESVADGMDATLELLARTLEESDYRRACPLTTVALDAAPESEPIRDACVEGFDSWQQAINETLAAQGIPADRAEEMATVALSAIEGALMLARTRRDVTPLRTVARHLRHTLEMELS